MNILVFDISGKFAHFRKYYTNSSSLSYSVPPRTMISGMIAGILGKERNSYYEEFTPQKARIGIRILTRNKKIMQSLNYLKIETTIGFEAPKNHTQIPFEILTNDKLIVFRIYFFHQDEELIRELEQRIVDQEYFYPPYLGVASFNCRISKVKIEQAELIKTKEEKEISSLIRIEEIERISGGLIKNLLHLERDKMPRFFDKDRYLQEAASYLMELSGKPIPIKTKEELLKVIYKEREEYISFM